MCIGVDCMKTFGQKLRESRKNKNMTQKQFAELIGAKHNSISNWENDQNKPDMDTIELICGTLDITPSYLLGWTDRPDKEINPDEGYGVYVEVEAKNEIDAYKKVAEAFLKEQNIIGENESISERKALKLFEPMLPNHLKSMLVQPPAEESLDDQLEGVDFALWGEVKEMTDAEKQDILDYIRFKKLKKGRD